MDKKKILIVCRGFYPDNNPRSFRATELAKEFALQGHEVTVITPKKNGIHDTFGKSHNLTIKDLGSPRLNTLNFGKSKIGGLLARAINRILQLAFEYPTIELMFMVKKALKTELGYDMLISVAVPYPIHWGVAWANSEKHPIAKTWIADCGDPFMGEKTDTFRRWFYFRYVEKWFMKKPDFISIPTENAKPGYYSEFHDKIRIIPQGFKIEPLTNTNKCEQNTIPTFAYAGSLNPVVRDPRPLLGFLESQEIDFKFYIFTRKRDIIDPFLKRLKGKVIVSDIIPRDELLLKLSEMDFLINFDNNTNIQVPSKLIDYAICNKPVLNITSNLDKKIVTEFLLGDYTHEMVLGNIDIYRIENICKSMLNLCNDKRAAI